MLLPLLLLVALAIKLDSRGPLLFRQRRYARHMRSFTVLKFRTMHDGATAESHRRYIASLAAGEHDEAPGLKKLVDDPRVTRVGRVLRRFSLDELPQFANVLAGSMSLIGPRPAIAYEVEHYLPHHYERFAVRPGLSGLWQVSGRNTIGFYEMLDLDVEYARNAGFTTDLPSLPAHTVGHVPRRVGLPPISELNWAIVGLGYWGPNLLRNAWELEGVQVKYMCDRDPDALAKHARRFPAWSGSPMSKRSWTTRRSTASCSRLRSPPTTTWAGACSRRARTCSSRSRWRAPWRSART